MQNVSSYYVKKPTRDRGKLQKNMLENYLKTYNKSVHKGTVFKQIAFERRFFSLHYSVKIKKSRWFIVMNIAKPKFNRVLLPFTKRRKRYAQIRLSFIIWTNSK